jgi:hypothetical protein
MSSLLKSEVKLSAVNELGCRLDDVLEESNKDLYRAEGAINALKQAVSTIENLMKVLDRELSDNDIDLDSCKTIKSYVDRSRVLLVNLATAAENGRQAHVGKIQGFQQAVAIAKRYREEELNKLALMREAIERNVAELNSEESSEDTEDRQARRPGTRPAPAIKARRRAEEFSATLENSQNVDNEETGEDSSESSKTKPKKQKK